MASPPLVFLHLPFHSISILFSCCLHLLFLPIFFPTPLGFWVLLKGCSHDDDSQGPTRHWGSVFLSFSHSLSPFSFSFFYSRFLKAFTFQKQVRQKMTVWDNLEHMGCQLRLCERESREREDIIKDIRNHQDYIVHHLHFQDYSISCSPLRSALISRCLMCTHDVDLQSLTNQDKRACLLACQSYICASLGSLFILHWTEQEKSIK